MFDVFLIILQVLDFRRIPTAASSFSGAIAIIGV
jgi:hypothetical protein